MDAARTQRIAEVLKTTKALGKTIKQPTVAAPAVLTALKEAQSRLPVADTSKSGWFITIAMYVIATLLAVGLILLVVDKWITPIYVRTPGGPGLITVPGTDNGQVFWPPASANMNIPIKPPGGTKSAINPNPTLGASVLEGQSSYTITADVYIKDEMPQTLPTGVTERFFVYLASPGWTTPRLTISLDNNKNTVYIRAYSTSVNTPLVIDNVPIRSPFRIGLIIKPYAMEGYLNGKLVKTVNLKIPIPAPQNGDSFLSLANMGPTISSNVVPASTGIQVFNLTAFGYEIDPTEMMGRMSTLPSGSAYS